MPASHEPQAADDGDDVPSTTSLGEGGFDGNVDRLPPGARLGRYVVDDVVGIGGTGVVYRAHDPDLGRAVAVKLLRASRGRDPQRAQARLLREAQAMASLSHPNVLPVFDVGTQDGRVFVAMELARGGTLRSWLKGARRSTDEVLRVLRAAGEGLVAAHAAGLVHRDFKPDNVLVFRDGSVRVSDFGLVRIDEGALSSESHAVAMSGSVPLTRAGALAGTPGYMAPEQYERGHEVGPAADQFAFAVTLYEALYGSRPFGGVGVAAVQAATCRGEVLPPPPGHRVPPWIRAILLRALRTDPEARFSSMRALLDALEQDPARRLRRWLTAAAVGTAIAAAAGGGFALAAQRSRVCAGGEARLRGVWDAGEAANMRAAFLGTGVAFAASSWERAERTLNRYAEEWVAGQKEACEATRLRGEQTEAILTLRMQCLEARRAELAAVVRVLSSGRREAVEHAVETTGALLPLRSCADGLALAAPVPPPSTPRAATELPRLSAALAEARALLWAERDAESREKLVGLEPEVRALGHLPLVAELLYVRGRVDWAVGDLAAAEATLLEACDVADEARHDAVRADAQLALINLVGNDLSRIEDGARHGRSAESLVRRLRDIDRERELRGRRAFYFLHVGKNEAALAEARAGLALGTDVGKEHSVVAELHSALAGAYAALGDLARAEDEDRQALALEEARLGPDHPALLPRVTNLAESLQGRGKLEEALAAAKRAVALAQSSLGGKDPKLAEAWVTEADALLELDRTDDALRAADRAVRLYDEFHPDMPRVGYALLTRALAERKLGRLAEARASAERAVRVLDDRQMLPLARARGHALLAEVTWELGLERDAALEGVRRARDELLAAGSREDAATVDGWLAAHPSASPPPSPRARR